MRYYFLWLLLAMASCRNQLHTNPVLFQVIENNTIGFIDSTGKVVIPPRFQNVWPFSEGLAAARVNGNYGYINASGKFVIPPQFDFGYGFREGYAIVYKEGHPYYIDHNGSKIFENPFPVVNPFSNGRAVVQTTTEKYGVIDPKGKLVIDTIYESIIPTEYNTFIVEKSDQPGIIDAQGKFIVPPGKYRTINRYANGYAEVTFPSAEQEEDDSTGFIDGKGQYIFGRRFGNHDYLGDEVSEGLVKIHFVKGNYAGFIDLNGNIIVNDTAYEYVYPFKNGRAIVCDFDRKYRIINKQGRLVTKQSFDEVLGNQFQYNMAFVEIEGKWGAVDTNGNFIFEPRFKSIIYDDIFNDHFFFSDDYDQAKIGVATSKGAIIVPARFQQVNKDGFQHGLLQVIEDNRLGYINRSGEYYWRQPAPLQNKADTLNIDYMKRGYFYGYSLPDKKSERGGWYTSLNIPKKIINEQDFAANRFSVEVRLRDTCRWYNKFAAAKLYVANNSRDTVYLEAQDSRLYMIIQALNAKGEWKAIEYLPGSWCGNSYHQVQLPPGYYWSFATPVYKGEFKTKLRARLTYLKNSSERETLTIYSNEFEGSINPAQFWRKESYTPQGLMDPYLD